MDRNQGDRSTHQGLGERRGAQETWRRFCCVLTDGGGLRTGKKRQQAGIWFFELLIVWNRSEQVADPVDGDQEIRVLRIFF